MDHVLAGSGIRLTYLQDQRAIKRIHWPTVFNDLIDAGAPPNRCQWCDLASLTHVVLATDRSTGCHVGLLGFVEREIQSDPWLWAEGAMVGPGMGGQLLLRAMTAHLLARVVSLDGKPLALGASSADPAIEAALRDVGHKIHAAIQHPPAEGNVVALGTARLARDMGASGLVIDLRETAESTLLRDLRSMHRVRVERTPKRVAATAASKVAKAGGAKRPSVKPARSASPTRRPKTAIRTGKTA